jgi:hypothetical protein
MAQQEHARAQPEGKATAKPGTKREEDYYRVVVGSKEEFATFRYHDWGNQVAFGVFQANEQVVHGKLKHRFSAKRMPMLRMVS